MSSRMRFTGEHTRRWIGLILLLLVGCTTDLHQTSSFRDIFDYYCSQPGITAISVPPSLLGIVLSQDDNTDNDLAELMKNLSAFRMMSVDRNDSNKSILQEIQDIVHEFTIRNKYSDLFVVRNSKDDLVIKIQEGEGVINEVVMWVSSEDAFTVINLRGKIKPEYFLKLAESGLLEDMQQFNFQK